MKPSYPNESSLEELMIFTKRIINICTAPLLPLVLILFLVHFIFGLVKATPFLAVTLLVFCGLSIIFECVGVVCALVSADTNHGNHVIHKFLIHTLPTAIILALFVVFGIFNF